MKRLQTSVLFLIVGAALLVSCNSQLTQLVTDPNVQRVSKGKQIYDYVQRWNAPYRSDEEYFAGRSMAATMFAKRRFNLELGTDLGSIASTDPTAASSEEELDLEAMAFEGGPYRDEAVWRYVATIGLALAAVSDRPEVFGGYSFEVLDKEGIGAWSTQGGHCLITRGAVEACPSEDALAGILAHEVAHIELRHISRELERRSRDGMIRDAIQALGDQFSDNAAAASALEVTNNDAVNFLLKQGFSREDELEADARAVELLLELGYRPQGYMEVLEGVKAGIGADPTGFTNSHPASDERIAAIRKQIQDEEAAPVPPARVERFDAIQEAIAASNP